jgi:hypothetical protein
LELYTLDANLRRVAVFDRFESLIWTERFSSPGDFELVTHADDKSRLLLRAGTRVTVNNSYRVGTVEEVEDKVDSEGRSLLSIKGPHLESIFDDRGSRGVGPTTTGLKNKWTFTSKTPFEIVQQIFNSICVANTPIPSDNLTNYTAGNLYPPDTLSIPTDIIPSYDVPMSTLNEIFKEFMETYGFGYRLYRGLDDGTLYFNFYMGSDRTTRQPYYEPVVFSPDLDNLGEVAQLHTIAGSKNVAYVYRDDDVTGVYHMIVALDGTDLTKATSLNRRVLLVDAGQLTETGTALTTAMTKLGKDELLKYRGLHAIDGQVPQNSKFRYGIDYNLGDLIEMRTDDGTTSFMRVTEHIYSSDENGDRSYPTVAENVTVTLGSWDAFNATLTWDAVAASLRWDDNPG